MMIFFLLFISAVVSPSVEFFNATNNVYGRADNQEVQFLGKFDNAQKCLDACISLGKVCGSFTWHQLQFPDKKIAQHCYGVTTGYFDWYPTKQSFVISGRIEWPCDNINDCSINGNCVDSNCVCKSGWRGHGCQILDTKPVDPKAFGLRSIINGKNFSTWGGSVQWDKETQLWHMWVSEMSHECGLNTWCQNSRIIHATSNHPSGPYKRQNVVFDRFAHEPTVTRDPHSGALVMFFTAQRPIQRQECVVCDNGITLNSCGQDQCNPDTDATYMSFAQSADGKWSDPVVVLNGTGSDTNLSPIIFPNGTLHAMWRSFAPTPTHKWFGSKLHILSAKNWKNPLTYIAHDENIFPSLSNPTNWGGAEDPFMYQTLDGVFHVVLHNMYGCNTGIGSRPCGTHAYSMDGWQWNLTGSGAYSHQINFIGSSNFIAISRERPHLILNRESSPIYLITGTGYNRDATFTVVQPLGNV